MGKRIMSDEEARIRREKHRIRLHRRKVLRTFKRSWVGSRVSVVYQEELEILKGAINRGEMDSVDPSIVKHMNENRAYCK